MPPPQSSTAAPAQAAPAQARSLDDLIAYFEGDWIPLRDAKVSIMTHAFMYGTAPSAGRPAGGDPRLLGRGAGPAVRPVRPRAHGAHPQLREDAADGEPAVGRRARF